jgi:hypothetical protein
MYPLQEVIIAKYGSPEFLRDTLETVHDEAIIQEMHVQASLAKNIVNTLLILSHLSSF